MRHALENPGRSQDIDRRNQPGNYCFIIVHLAGNSFVFINDHDPKPLYYEFRSIYGDAVGCEYLQRGEQEWTVKVMKLKAKKQ